MAITSTRLGSGEGWCVHDVVCTSGPHDRTFEEQHEWMCIALVTSGSFRYRTALGSAILSPGSVLLGNVGMCYECGHEHGTGDRCLSFQFAPSLFESIVATVPGRTQLGFSESRLPFLPALLPIIATAQAARDAQVEPAQFEELAIRIAGAISALVGDSQVSKVPSERDAKRVASVLRRIEDRPHEAHSLQDLAEDTSTSPYHLLRIFEQIVGVTPHQFLLRTRLRHAAVRLRTSDEAISAIALDCGFGDLSTFNRHFRRLIGVTPGAYRAQRHA